jgi:hypothetical protein
VAAVADIAVAMRQSLDTAGGLRVATPGMREESVRTFNIVSRALLSAGAIRAYGCNIKGGELG